MYSHYNILLLPVNIHGKLKLVWHRNDCHKPGIKFTAVIIRLNSLFDGTLQINSHLLQIAFVRSIIVYKSKLQNPSFTLLYEMVIFRNDFYCSAKFIIKLIFREIDYAGGSAKRIPPLFPLLLKIQKTVNEKNCRRLTQGDISL